MRAQLKNLLALCPQCCERFADNVALLADGTLTDAQVEYVLGLLLKEHGGHA